MPPGTLAESPSMSVPSCRDRSGQTSEGRRLVAVLVGSGVLAATARHARRREITAPESEIFAALNQLPAWVTPPLYVLMQAGQFGMVPATAFLAGLMRRRRLARALVTAGSVSWVAARVVKHLANRGRPDAHLDGVVVRGKEWTGLGFPSGHAAVAASLAAVAAPELAAWIRPLTWTFVAVVGVSRVHVGAHLPVDTVGGAALGIAVGNLTELFLPREEGRAVEPPAGR